MKRVIRIGIALAAVCLTSGLAVGQILYGNLVGNVTDAQQAAVVSAAVTIKNNATGYSAATKTDFRGAIVSCVAAARRESP